MQLGNVFCIQYAFHALLVSESLEIFKYCNNGTLGYLPYYILYGILYQNDNKMLSRGYNAIITMSIFMFLSELCVTIFLKLNFWSKKTFDFWVDLQKSSPFKIFPTTFLNKVEPISFSNFSICCISYKGLKNVTIFSYHLFSKSFEKTTIWKRVRWSNLISQPLHMTYKVENPLIYKA